MQKKNYNDLELLLEIQPEVCLQLAEPTALRLFVFLGLRPSRYLLWTLLQIYQTRHTDDTDKIFNICKFNTCNKHHFNKQPRLCDAQLA